MQSFTCSVCGHSYQALVEDASKRCLGCRMGNKQPAPVVAKVPAQNGPTTQAVVAASEGPNDIHRDNSAVCVAKDCNHRTNKRLSAPGWWCSPVDSGVVYCPQHAPNKRAVMPPNAVAPKGQRTKAKRAALTAEERKQRQAWAYKKYTEAHKHGTYTCKVNPAHPATEGFYCATCRKERSALWRANNAARRKQGKAA